MALTEDKLLKKREALVARTATALAIDSTEAARLLSIGRSQSIRINTLSSTSAHAIESLEQLGVEMTATPWMTDGRFVNDSLGAARDSALASDGTIYIQNAASWLPVLALDPQPDEHILDMCAAPGGKTSHIAQRANNRAFITANDNSRPRLHKLQRNLERLNVSNVTFTLYDATRLSVYLTDAQFDKILLDAPCSGEGMMTLDDKKSFESWSVAHIQRLQKLQKKLIVQAWKVLKPGGTLIYSTCTMAPEENEAVIDYLLRHNDDVVIEPLNTLKHALNNTVKTVGEWNGKQFDQRVERALRLAPSPHVEAFFVAKLTKAEDTPDDFVA